MVLIDAIFQSIFGSIMIILITYDADPGYRTLSISLDTDQLVAILVGVIFLFVGHMFTQAVLISDESRQFI